MLLLEHDADLRHRAADMLFNLGPFVPTAQNEQEALPLLKDHELDVMVMPLALPGSDGLPLAGRARAVQPALRVLFGVSDDTPASAPGAWPPRALPLGRPCDPGALGAALSRVTGQR